MALTENSSWKVVNYTGIVKSIISPPLPTAESDPGFEKGGAWVCLYIQVNLGVFKEFSPRLFNIGAPTFKGATIRYSGGGGGGLEFLSRANYLFQPGSAAR